MLSHVVVYNSILIHYMHSLAGGRYSDSLKHNVQIWNMSIISTVITMNFSLTQGTSSVLFPSLYFSFLPSMINKKTLHATSLFISFLEWELFLLLLKSVSLNHLMWAWLIIVLFVISVLSLVVCLSVLVHYYYCVAIIIFLTLLLNYYFNFYIIFFFYHFGWRWFCCCYSFYYYLNTL